MNNIGSVEENKSMIENVSKSIEEYISSTKDSIVNNPVVNKGSDVLNSSSQIVSRAVNNINMQNAKEVMMDTVTNSSTSIYFIIILLVLAGIVCYILYYIIVDNVIYQKRMLLSGTEVPLLCTKLNKFSITDILESGNGNKRTYCFWIYILETNNTESYKNIAYIIDPKNADDTNNINKSSLCIRLSKNSIQIRFGNTETGVTNANAVVNLSSDNTAFLTKSYGTSPETKYICGVEIEYIPIQRWVHVGVVLKDNYYSGPEHNGNGSITIYIDGNFIKTLDNTNTKDYPSYNSAILDTNKFELEHTGHIYIGGYESPTGTSPLGFSGLLSRFTIFNYDLNRNDIFKEYVSGPIKGGLSSFGLSAYGIRSPIYKLNNKDSVVYY